MEDYQIRVIEEREALEEKIHNLELYIESESFANLPTVAEQNNLEFQLDVMILYSKILEARINCF